MALAVPTSSISALRDGLWSANNVRHQHEYDLVLLVLRVILREKILQDRNRSQPRYSAQRFGLLVFHDPTEQVHFPFLQADFVFDFALPDHGWLMPPIC